MELKLENGILAPNFQLLDLDGRKHELVKYRGRIVILNFWSAECPWSEQADEKLKAASKNWERELVAILTIAPNVNESEDLIHQVAAERQLPVVLLDREQRVTDLYGAVTTPQVFVLDPAGFLRYQGAIDDATFRKPEATHFYAVEAVESIIHGLSPEPAFAPPYGCAIVREID